MASQRAEETYKVKLAPSDDGEPAPELPSSSSLDPDLDSREILEMNRAQAVIQNPGPQDNPQPQAPNQGAANVGENNGILELSFPRKLWMIVEDNAFTSVRWNDAGDTVIIDKDLFQREVLHRRGAERIFETDSLKSFIRLLNQYGFSKIRATDPCGAQSPENKRMMVSRKPLVSHVFCLFCLFVCFLSFQQLPGRPQMNDLLKGFNFRGQLSFSRDVMEK